MGSTKGGFQWQNWNLKTGYKTIQWRSKVSAPLCACCNKTVFPAEEIIGAGQRFHKFCLKCTACNTFLNSGNLNEHEKKIYCSSCYCRQFGPRRISHGLTTTTSLSLDIETPPTSPHLNEIETNVDNYHHERITSTGSSISHTSSDDDSRLSSNFQINSITAQQIKHLSSSINLTSFKSMLISGNICPRCSKTVYLAEGVKAAGKLFHKLCYSCANCKSGISGARYCEHNGELYDNNCYQRLFGRKGIILTGN